MASVKVHTAWTGVAGMFFMLSALGALGSLAIIMNWGFLLAVPALGLLVFSMLIGFIAGDKMQTYICSDCGNRVDNKRVKLCPTCKTELSSY